MELQINKGSKLLEEYDFTQEDPKKMSVSEFSSRAIKSGKKFFVHLCLLMYTRLILRFNFWGINFLECIYISKTVIETLLSPNCEKMLGFREGK